MQNIAKAYRGFLRMIAHIVLNLKESVPWATMAARHAAHAIRQGQGQARSRRMWRPRTGQGLVGCAKLPLFPVNTMYIQWNRDMTLRVGLMAGDGEKKKSKKTSQLVIRLDPKERDSFVALCERLDTSASREIRHFIRRYVAKNADRKDSADAAE